MSDPTPLAELAAVLVATPTPVLAIDTNTFLDLIRVDPGKLELRLSEDEVRVASELLADHAGGRAHLVVPELVPAEWAEHVDTRMREAEAWVEKLNRSLATLASVGQLLGGSHTGIPPYSPVDFAGGLADTAGQLLGACRPIARDTGCITRALDRVLKYPRRPPSLNNEIKDSINLEQVLELARLLRLAGFSKPVYWISADVKDFADDDKRLVHPKLTAEFDAVGLIYSVSLRAAVGRLRADGHLPKP